MSQLAHDEADASTPVHDQSDSQRQFVLREAGYRPFSAILEDTKVLLPQGIHRATCSITHDSIHHDQLNVYDQLELIGVVRASKNRSSPLGISGQS
jgi:hypothetical protein